MPESEQLYQSAIIDLARAENAKGRLPHADATAVIHNPLCGDRVTVDVCATVTTVTNFSQLVRGCVLCEAAASWLGLHIRGQSLDALLESADAITAMMRGEHTSLPAPFDELDMFSPVADYRSRHRCVSLPFEALVSALHDVRALK
jgi:nitrogen fixation NifU-like protein